MRAVLTLLEVLGVAAITIVGLVTVVYVVCLTTGLGYRLVVDPVHEPLGMLLSIGQGRRVARRARRDREAAARGACQ